MRKSDFLPLHEPKPYKVKYAVTDFGLWILLGVFLPVGIIITVMSVLFIP